MNSLLQLKTQRIIGLSLLDEENILEAIKSFEKYMGFLGTFVNADNDTQIKIVKEITTVKIAFLGKLHNLAKKCIEEKNYDNALICLTEVVRYWSDNVLCLIDYALCLDKMGQIELRNKIIAQLHSVLPKNNPELCKETAMMYEKIGEYEKAIEYFNNYINETAETKISYNDYSILAGFNYALYDKTHDIQYCEKTIENLKIADSLNPNNKGILRNIIYTANVMNDYKTQEEYLRKILGIKPICHEDLFHKSIISLKQKDVKSFYENYDERFVREDKPVWFPNIEDKPMWRGENLADKTLLVHFEQGFGDTLLMSGFIPRLTKLAKKVIFVVQNHLLSLIDESFSNLENLVVLPIQDDVTKLDFDYYIPTMSIPIALDLPVEDLSFDSQYLFANSGLTEEFKKRFFNNDKLKIGIAFAGNKKVTGNIHLKDIPVSAFLPLDNIEGIELYSLAKDLTEKDFVDFKNNKVNVLADYMHDFTYTASIIDNCDIIISADNVILNLAGAMNKKTYGLFNWYYEYRWYDLTGEDCGWFKSVKPFVNPKMDDWKTSISKVTEEIKQIAEK